MILEVTDRAIPPYRYAVLVVSTFSDGSRAMGSGALVGPNDVLTATHVVYDPDRNGWATDLAIYPAVDFNARSNVFDSPPLTELGAYSWHINGWPRQAFQDDNHNTLTMDEAQYDLAVIGISATPGYQLGWFGLAPGYDAPQAAYQLGYPVGGTGLMAGQAWVERATVQSVYSAYAAQGSDIMGAGSSGGPLYVFDERGGAQLIGVRTSGNDTTSQWADIGLLYSEILRAIAQNDVLLVDGASVLSGTPGNDQLAHALHHRRVEGGDGLDTLGFSDPAAVFHVRRDGDLVRVNHLYDSAPATELTSIERLAFTDGRLALDVAAGETAGSLYRLYQAAFARTPDITGLNYWLQTMDDGLPLAEAAFYFMQSKEFQNLYGSQPSDEALLTRYYQNVLARSPDADGYSFWLAQLDNGLDAAQMLVYFSESSENQQRVAGAIEDGIWLG